MTTWLSLQDPVWLLLLPLATAPWWPRVHEPVMHISMSILPADKLSTQLHVTLRWMTCLGIISLITALGSPYTEDTPRSIEGEGADMVFLLDRSSSMNENFSGRYLGGSASETKNAEARQLLDAFVRQRPHDLFGMVAFSAAPMYVMPLTDKRSAILAAIHASSDRGHGATRIGEGLLAALDLFPDPDPEQGNRRALILVSDGAAEIEPLTQALIRKTVEIKQSNLYWLYLRSRLGAHLDAVPRQGETPSPEFLLDSFFRTMGDRYHGWEADNPEQVRAALSQMATLESHPFRHTTVMPRRDQSSWFVLAATILLLPRCLTLWMEP
ncbi:MAG: hypothetical protein RIQ52_828 [Pseudomonadota bacterium]